MAKCDVRREAVTEQLNAVDIAYRNDVINAVNSLIGTASSIFPYETSSNNGDINKARGIHDKFRKNNLHCV